jgi:hypothetical protein
LFFHGIKHFAEIAELFGVWKFLECPSGMPGIHVTERNDICIRSEGIDISAPHAADADCRKVWLFAGWWCAATGNQVSGHNHKGGCRCACGSKEISSREGLSFHKNVMGEVLTDAGGLASKKRLKKDGVDSL